MSHNNPESLVPASLHRTREGQKAFILYRVFSPPWGRPSGLPHYEIAVCTEGGGLYGVALNGAYFFHSGENPEDLVSEWEETPKQNESLAAKRLRRGASFLSRTLLGREPQG